MYNKHILHNEFYISIRECLGCLFRKKKQEDQTCQNQDETNLSKGLTNENYFVLEKHTKEVHHCDSQQFNNDQDDCALPLDPTEYKAINTNQDDDYSTTEQSKDGRGKHTQPSNIYNTFNDFKKDDNYDHIGDRKKYCRNTDNEYNATRAIMSPPIDVDTYNHLDEEPNTVARPDNVYGMTRASVEKNYATREDLANDDDYSTIDDVV